MRNIFLLCMFLAITLATPGPRAQGRPPEVQSGFIPLGSGTSQQSRPAGDAQGSGVAREFQRGSAPPAGAAQMPPAGAAAQPTGRLPPAAGGGAQGQAAAAGQAPAPQQRNAVPGRNLQSRPDPNVSLDQLQQAWANPVAAPGQLSPGVRRYSFSQRDIENRVLKIATRPYMLTSIHLPACEQIDDFYLGDDYAFEIKKPRDNVIIASAYFAKGDTNMQVVGRSGTRYSFYIYSESIEARTITDTSVYVDVEGLCDSRQMGDARNVARRFNGPAPTRESGQMNRDYLRTMPLNVDQLQFDAYDVYVSKEKDKIIAPDRVFSDGVWVYLDYGERISSIRLPAAFATVDGVDQPANTRMIGANGQIYAVQAPNSDITLKNGTAVVCIRLRKAGASGKAIVDKELGLKARNTR